MNPLRPSKQISPIVITSKAAQDDFLNIKAQHDELLRSYTEHSLRVQQNNTERSAREGEQQKMDNEKQKNNNDFAAKTAETDVKRSALAMK